MMERTWSGEKEQQEGGVMRRAHKCILTRGIKIKSFFIAGDRSLRRRCFRPERERRAEYVSRHVIYLSQIRNHVKITSAGPTTHKPRLPSPAASNLHRGPGRTRRPPECAADRSPDLARCGDRAIETRPGWGGELFRTE